MVSSCSSGWFSAITLRSREPSFHSSPVFASIVVSLEVKFIHRGESGLQKMEMLQKKTYNLSEAVYISSLHSYCYNSGIRKWIICSRLKLNSSKIIAWITYSSVPEHYPYVPAARMQHSSSQDAKAYTQLLSKEQLLDRVPQTCLVPMELSQSDWKCRMKHSPPRLHSCPNPSFPLLIPTRQGKASTMSHRSCSSSQLIRKGLTHTKNSLGIHNGKKKIKSCEGVLQHQKIMLP